MEEIGYRGKLRRKSVKEVSYGGNRLWRKATEEIGYRGKLRRKSVKEVSYGGNRLWRKATEEIELVLEKNVILSLLVTTAPIV